MTDPNHRLTAWDRDLTATFGVALYSLTVAFGFARVFGGWEFLGDMVVLVVAGHGVSFGLRRWRVAGWIAVPFVSLLLLWVLMVQQYRETLTWLFPTRATQDLLSLEVGLVRDQFQSAVAPVLYGAGWATLAGFALIVAIMMSDAFAFRAEARGEALVPGGVLFIFIAALGSPRMRIGSTAALVAAGVLAVVALRALHDRTRRVELTTGRGTASKLIPAALATAVTVALLAGVVGPRIPGAKAEPLFETRGRGGGITEVVSPLVDIRSRLTNRGNIELFKVNADKPAYWRATTLPEFDGRTFGLPTRPVERVEGSFGVVDVGSREIRQHIQVLALGGNLLPVAADPVAAEGSLALQLNRDTSTLVTPKDQELGPGDLFTVVSAAPQLQPEQLRAATTSSPPDSIFVELPDDLPDIVADRAAEVTAGTTTSYDAAMALQSWFRNDFEYSLEVQQGHGSSAIESFLLEQVGYCEQFSATFAAMARTLGIPSRVAVGFTPGVVNEEGWYSVLGKNAHAWPELWFDGIGWVAFEPTPGRGAPGAEAYTDVPAQQDESPAATGGGTDPNLPPNPTTPSTVVPPPTSAGDSPTPTTVVQPGSGLPDEPTTPSGGAGVAPVAGSDNGVSWTPILIAALIALLLSAPWLARRLRSQIRRGVSPADRVLDAWERATAAAQRAGVRGAPSMTAHEWATATAAQLPVAARPMSSLAGTVDIVSYAPADHVDFTTTGSFGATLDHDCELWSEQVERIADDTLSAWERVRRYFTSW